MALFQKIKTPFSEPAPEGEGLVPSGPRSVGEVLRQQRQEYRLTIEEVAAALKIKPAYLEALEEGKPEGLPGPAYAVGFARSYSNFLGLDSAEVLRRLKAESAELGVKPDLSFPMPLGEKSLPSGTMLLFALFLAAAAYGGWYFYSSRAHLGIERVGPVPSSLLPKPKPAPPAQKKAAAPAEPLSLPAPAPPLAAASSSAASPPAPALSSVPAATPAPAPPTPAATPEAGVATGGPKAPAGAPEAPAAVPSAAPPAAPSAANGAAPPSPSRAYGANSARIVIRASAPSWVEVRGADRSILFEKVLKPGESYRVPDEPGVTLWTGNAGALSILVDGKPVPPLESASGVLRHVALDPRALLAGKAAGG